MLLAALVGASVVPLRAQSTPDQKSPAFDVASIKPNTSGAAPGRISSPPGRFSASNVNLRLIVRNAYSVQDFQISGGPNWMDADRFDIEATAEAPTTSDQIRAMTRTLLQDRFKLVMHSETRELPIYLLTVARRDGRLGEQMRKAGAECKPMMPLPGAPPPPPAPPSRAAPSNTPQCPSMLALGGISGRQLRIERLVATLSQFTGRQIVDETNLTGTFDFDLQWTPDSIPGGGRGFVLVAPFDPNGPSLFTALQEQLGLKLQSTKGPVDVVVIDHVERPTPD